MQVDNPDLYANDLIFGIEEPLFTYLIYYYRFLNHLISLPWISIISQFLSYALLFFALMRLASVLSGRKISVLATVAILLIAPTTIIGGHHLTYVTFYPQYAAYAATLLAFSFMIERRLIEASICVAFALFAYPLVGLHALLITIGVLIFFPALRTKIPATIIILSLATIIALLPSALAYSFQDISKESLEKYLDILVYIRSRHHFCLSCMEDKPDLRLAMVVLFATIFHLKWGRLSETKYRITSLLIICLFVGTIISFVNNELFMNYLLFQTNPAKSSPVILGLLLCYGLIVLNARVEKGLFVSTAFVLCSGTPLSLLLISSCDILWERINPKLTVAIQRQDYFKKSIINAMSSNRSYDFLITVVGIIFTFLIFSDKNLYMIHMSAFGFSAIILLFFARCNSPQLKHVAGLTLVFFAVIGLVEGTLPAKVKVLNPEREWADISFQVSQKIPEDAVVVIPPGYRDQQFQYLSKRAAFVTFSHFSRIPKFGLEWLERMKMIKALPINCCEEKLRGPVRVFFNRYHYMKERDFMAIHKKYSFVKYCVVSRNVTLNMPLIHENRSYRLYRIDQSSH